MNIKKIVYEKLSSITSKKFTNSTKIDDLGIDSLDMVELSLDIEEEYEIILSNEVLNEIKTVNDIIEAFTKANK